MSTIASSRIKITLTFKDEGDYYQDPVYMYFDKINEASTFLSFASKAKGIKSILLEEQTTKVETFDPQLYLNNPHRKDHNQP